MERENSLVMKKTQFVTGILFLVVILAMLCAYSLGERPSETTKSEMSMPVTIIWDTVSIENETVDTPENVTNNSGIQMESGQCYTVISLEESETLVNVSN